MRVGLLGGTFDPVHLGHLRAAECAREAMDLDRVAFIPSHNPPHRKGPQASSLDRYAMVAVATAGHPAFEPSDVELRRDGPSYTVDTVAEWLTAKPGDSLVLIVGSDTFDEMSTWKDRERLLALCTLAVVARPSDVDEAPTSSAGVELVAGPGLAISSTEIRQRLAAGRSVRYLVPDGVADYIAKRGLYH